MSGPGSLVQGSPGSPRVPATSMAAMADCGSGSKSWLRGRGGEGAARHLRHTRLIPRTHQPAVNELIHQDQETPPVTNPLGATSLPPSDLLSKVITKWSPRAKLEAELVPSLMTFGGH